MRVAGWLAVLSGVAAMSVAVLSDSIAATLAGAYGLLFIVTGGWTLLGLHLLARRERRAQTRRVAARTIPNQRGALGQ